MNPSDEKEPRIKIDPLPLPDKKNIPGATKAEQDRVASGGKGSILPSKEPATFASGKKIGRPAKPENARKTDDAYTMTPARKRALEKARVMKALKREGKNIKEPIDFEPDVINSEIGVDPSAKKDAYPSLPFKPLDKPVVQNSDKKQIAYGLNGDPQIFDIYNNRIAELEQQIATLKKTKHIAISDIEYPERKGIDQMTGVNMTLKQDAPQSLYKVPITTHHGRQQSTGILHNVNPFATKKARQKLFQ